MTAALISSTIHAALKSLEGQAASTIGARLKSLLTNRAARSELKKIAGAAIKEAISAAPQLSDGLLSDGYLTDILQPALVVSLGDPTSRLSADDLSAKYVERYIQPYLGERPLDGVLAQYYDINQEQLQAVFERLQTALRSGFYKSKHWRTSIGEVSTEEIRVSVAELVAAKRDAAQERAAGDLAAARQDARVGSDHLRSWPRLIRGLHIDRPELETLINRIKQEPSATTLLVGISGSGKSALLAQLTERMENDGHAVFALKADKLPKEIFSLADVSTALGLAGDIVREIDTLLQAGPVVLIIDQLDAVSEVMDTTSDRMRLLLNLATRWRTKRHHGESGHALHVVVSSRPFEARHDARFETLRATDVQLSLPSYDRIEALLRELSVDPLNVPEQLRETIRRPFMLKLYVDLVERGARVDELTEADLLNAWLASTHFGSKTDREDTLKLLVALAAEMTVTESLWRPADKFDVETPEAVKRAEACELIIREDGRLGFAHQAWLDDFQAKRFLTGQQLAEYAWETQDGLFSRSTILRSLERYRRFDTPAYDRALDLLLGEQHTRRHLRHLVVDLIGTQAQPFLREIAWIQRLIRDETGLALRAIARVEKHWSAWREALAPLIPVAASRPEIVWGAVAMSTAEAKLDPVEGERLIGTVWSEEAFDKQAFDVAWRATLWTPSIRDRIKAILSRAEFNDVAISMYVDQLADGGKPEAGAELLGYYLTARPYNRHGSMEFHGLSKVVDAAPLAYTDAVLPWFVQIATGGERPQSALKDNYPISYNLPLGWQGDWHRDGNALSGLVHAVQAIAKSDAASFLELARSVSDVESDEVQALVADGFAAAGDTLASQALDWLLEDPRRLLVGHTQMQDEDSVWCTVSGWSSRELVRSIAPYLTVNQARTLASAIETWNAFAEAVAVESDAKGRRQLQEHAESYRVPLLNLLPSDALPARRQRQISEAAAAEPQYKPRRGPMMATAVPSPMSAAQMALASDDALFKMLDEIHDASGASASRRRFMSGGVSQLSQAFAAFGVANRARAIALVRERLLPNRHEHAAGALILDLSQQQDVDAVELRDVIRLLAERGFTSDDFRRQAAWAFDNIASRLSGLEECDVNLLASWLSRDDEKLGAQEARRREVHAENKKRNKANAKSSAQPLLFGQGGGLKVLPAGNYTILRAIGSGLLRRDPPDYQAWLDFLSRHVGQPEEVDVWEATLHQHGWALHWVEAKKAEDFIQALFKHRPEVFDAALVNFLWRSRPFIPEEIQVAAIRRWLASGEEEDRQFAGEFAFACRLVSPEENPRVTDLADELANGSDTAAKLGAAFAAAAAWREPDPVLRRRAHEVLLPLAREASGTIAEAVSSALDHQRTLPPDELTRELLSAARDNPALLKACLNGRFEDALQDLLNHPGLDHLVLEIAERGAEVMLQHKRERGAYISHDLVGISIALQRNTGEIRVRAMDVYERLLDADVYGADQAARAALRR